MPETTAYLLLGLAVTAIIMLFLIGSMVVRQRNLHKDIQLIDQLGQDQS